MLERKQYNRNQLQKFCKMYGIRANQKNETIVAELIAAVKKNMEAQQNAKAAQKTEQSPGSRQRESSDC